MSLPSPPQRLAAFREQLTKSNIDCFIQSTADAHQSEYVCDRDKRIAFLSAFTGSAGTIVVTQKEALLWTDGRYFLSANAQLSDDWTLMKMGLPETPSVPKWIAANADIAQIGVDPLLTSPTYHKRLCAAIAVAPQKKVIFVGSNPIDAVWADAQPPMPSQPIFVHEAKFSGQSTQHKIEAIRAELAKKGIFGLIVSALDEIAWTLNLRGSDILYNPVFFAYLIITADDARLFVDANKLKSDSDEEKNENGASAHLTANSVAVGDYGDFLRDLTAMVNNDGARKFWIDPSKCNLAIREAIPQSQRHEGDGPIALMKALKNETEIGGFRACHIRDGAAKSRFFAWIAQLRAEGKEAIEKHSEWTFAEKLLSLRREADLFVDLSFETISSVGPNGAVIHYAPSEKENAQITANEMYLLDSGGQYLDGTTDTTRTTWLGVDGAKPSAHRKECYTRVLKGVIALTKMVFPYNTKGPQIDSVARAFLWQIGLDYRHGTGHGVGCFLNVHEGPHGFSASTARRGLYEYGLRTGMIITNEPGYYEADGFGVRIENVMVVVEAQTKHRFGGQQFCTFETCTMVPICKELIAEELMTSEEVAWLDAYHREVFEKIAPLMKTQYEKEWLKQATAPMKQ